MSSIMAKLKKARQEWEDIETPEEGGGYEDLPEGKYAVEITTAELKEDKNGGAGILYVFTVTKGEHKGKTQSKWSGVLDNHGTLLPENHIKWVKRELATLLGEPPDLDELEDILAGMVGKETSIRVKRNGEYTNTYIADEARSSDDSEDEENEDEEEESFPRRPSRQDSDDDDEEEEEDKKPARGRKASRSSRDDDDDDNGSAEVARLLAKANARKKR